MKVFRGSLSIVATTVLVVGCSSGSQDSDPTSPGTVTVTYSSSTSNAPSTTTVTPGPSGSPGADGSTGTDASTGPDRTTGTTPGASQPAPTSTRGGPAAPAPPAKDDTRLPTEAAAYADGFVRAWGAGDRGKASRYATARTVTTLFGADALGGTTWKRQGSTDEGARTRVQYVDDIGRTLDVVVDESSASSGTTEAVVGAILAAGATADPTKGGDGDDSSGVVGLPRSVTDYADAMIRAWGKDDLSAWDYATDEVMKRLYAEYGSGGPRWSRSSSTSSSVTYTNKDGARVVLTVDSGRVALGQKDAVTAASIS